MSSGYDPGSRLVKWTDSTLAGPETYGYDVYGNMTSVSRYNGSGSTVTFGVAASTNQISTAGYDAAGNLVSGDGSGRTYEYDGLNMMRKSGSTGEGWTYDVYGPDEERLGVLDTATGMWTWSARGFDAQVPRQFRSSSVTPSADWLWVEDYVYRGGTLAAAERVREQGGRRHFHLDHLGTPRLVTGPSEELVAQHDYTPYGIEVTSPCQETSNGFDREEPKRFTMHEREFAPNCGDATVLDYMHARYYSASSGRLLSTDRARATATSPLTWNRGTYALDNPRRFVDRQGNVAVLFTGFSGPNNNSHMYVFTLNLRRIPSIGHWRVMESLKSRKRSRLLSAGTQRIRNNQWYSLGTAGEVARLWTRRSFFRRKGFLSTC